MVRLRVRGCEQEGSAIVRGAKKVRRATKTRLDTDAEQPTTTHLLRKVNRKTLSD